MFFLFFILQRIVAESLSVESADQFVNITKSGKKLLKSNKVEEVLLKMGISPIIYFDESNYGYLLTKNDTLQIKKEKRTKLKSLNTLKK